MASNSTPSTRSKDAGAHVAEARNLEAGDERRAVRLVAGDETYGTVAYGADNLARSVGPFDDRLQCRCRGTVEIHAGAVSATQTDGVI